MRRNYIVGLGVAAVTFTLLAVGVRYGFAGTTTAAGEQVCANQPITFFAESAGPGATSNQFPVGTRLQVTNLDNHRSITVTVTGPSGSCILLNTAAMDAVREPGKNVVRHNQVRRLPGAAAPTRAGTAQAGQDGNRTLCPGNITFFADTAPAAATSNRFPVGTRLRVTNLDIARSIVVTVTGPSASCVLLNTAAMDAVREPGKNVIRNNTVTRVG